MLVSFVLRPHSNSTGRQLDHIGLANNLFNGTIPHRLGDALSECRARVLSPPGGVPNVD